MILHTTAQNKQVWISDRRWCEQEEVSHFILRQMSLFIEREWWKKGAFKCDQFLLPGQGSLWTFTWQAAFTEHTKVYISRLKNEGKYQWKKSLHWFSTSFPWRSVNFCFRLNQFLKHFCQSDWGFSKTCILNELLLQLSWKIDLSVYFPRTET